MLRIWIENCTGEMLENCGVHECSPADVTARYAERLNFWRQRGYSPAVCYCYA